MSELVQGVTALFHALNRFRVVPSDDNTLSIGCDECGEIIWQGETLATESLNTMVTIVLGHDMMNMRKHADIAEVANGDCCGIDHESEATNETGDDARGNVGPVEGGVGINGHVKASASGGI